MDFKIVGRTIGMIWIMVALLMLPSIFLAAYDHDQDAMWAYIAAAAVMSSLGLLLWYSCNRARKKPSYTSEGIVTVGLAWISVSAFGAVPFCISGEIPNYIDAFFEMVPASPRPVPPSSAMWKPLAGQVFTGAASAIGWAAWACWSLFSPLRRAENSRQAST